MAEYIDREAFKAEVRRLPTHYLNEWDTLGVLAAADRIPAADVRPVVRGEWQSWTQDRPPCKWYSCDYCGFHALSKSNYCSNYGAMMEES